MFPPYQRVRLYRSKQPIKTRDRPRFLNKSYQRVLYVFKVNDVDCNSSHREPRTVFNSWLYPQLHLKWSTGSP
jgi:hypothetical protein